MIHCNINISKLKKLTYISPDDRDENDLMDLSNVSIEQLRAMYRSYNNGVHASEINQWANVVLELLKRSGLAAEIFK